MFEIAGLHLETMQRILLCPLLFAERVLLLLPAFSRYLAFAEFNPLTSAGCSVSFIGQIEFCEGKSGLEDSAMHVSLLVQSSFELCVCLSSLLLSMTLIIYEPHVCCLK